MEVIFGTTEHGYPKGYPMIRVINEDGESFHDVLEWMNKELDSNEEFKAKVLEVMPEDYDFIMLREKYGCLFGLGSPQMFECGWKFTVEYYAGNTKVTLTGFQ